MRWPRCGAARTSPIHAVACERFERSGCATRVHRSPSRAARAFADRVQSPAVSAAQRTDDEIIDLFAQRVKSRARQLSP